MATRRRRCGHVAAVGNADHLRDQVDVGDELGDGVLDLDACVEFEKPDLIARHQELGRAGAAVVSCPSKRNSRFIKPRAQRVIDDRRGALLEHLLVPTLDRAVALAERDHTTVGIGKQLDFDVVRALDKSLGVHAAITKGALGFARRGSARLVELVGRAHDAHAAPATTGRRLE